MVTTQSLLYYFAYDSELSRTPILYAHSLGGAIAIDLASRGPSTHCHRTDK